MVKTGACLLGAVPELLESAGLIRIFFLVLPVERRAADLAEELVRAVQRAAAAAPPGRHAVAAFLRFLRRRFGRLPALAFCVKLLELALPQLLNARFVIGRTAVRADEDLIRLFEFLSAMGTMDAFVLEHK